MYGWRGRIGVLVPPGNPTVEPELYRMAPAGVSVHFARFEPGEDMREPGGADGLEERTRALLAGLATPARALVAVKPHVVVLAHTGASYVNGFANEADLVDRLAALSGTAAVTAARAGLTCAGISCAGISCGFGIAGRPEPFRWYNVAPGMLTVRYSRKISGFDSACPTASHPPSTRHSRKRPMMRSITGQSK